MSRGKWNLDWRSRAACLQQEPEKFFPAGRPPREQLDVCASCPVRQQCLEFALNSPWQPMGIWGGQTTRQLEPLWRERHPAAREREISTYLGIAG